MRKFLLYATLAILLITPAAWGSYGFIWYNINVSDLPASCEDGEVMAIIDGNSASDCTTGGSTTTVVCYCEDNAWSAIGGGAATGSGTQWYLPQWADNSGTLEDSTIYHDDDVGVDRYGVGDGTGATAPSGILHLSRASGNPALYITTDGGSSAKIFFKNPSSLGGTSSGWIGQNDFNLRIFGAYGGITLSDPSNQTTSAQNTMVIWPDGDISIGNAGVIVNPTNRTDGTNTLKHVNLYPGRMFQFGNWASDPTVGDTGTVYYSTSTGHLRAYMNSPSPGWYDLHGGAHTTDTDTNANTECSGTTTYLDGEGNCDDLQSTAYAITADWDFGGGGIEIENGTTPPACTVGQIYLDTDATSGQQLMACEGGSFVLQGDGGGTPPADSVGTVELDDDANTPVAGYAVIVETGALSFDYLDQSGWDQDSSDDFSPTDIDTDYAAETVASLWDFTSNLTLDSVTADTTLDAATGNEIAYVLDFTVNKASSGNATGLKMNMTDTLSPGDNLLMDLQVGAASKFTVSDVGNVVAEGTLEVASQGYFDGDVRVGTTGTLPEKELHVITTTVAELGLENTAGATPNTWDIRNDNGNLEIGLEASTEPIRLQAGSSTRVLDVNGSAVTLLGDWDFGSAGIEIENGTTPPGCTVGQLYLDTDATSGSQLMACEGGTFVTQGGGGSFPGFTDIDTDYGIETVTSAWTITGDWDFGGGGIEIENGTTPPACTVGQLYLDTDATSGQQLMACEGGTFVKQGDGSGSGSPGGSDSYVQYNDGGSFGGESTFVYDDVNNRLGIGDDPTPGYQIDMGTSTGDKLAVYSNGADTTFYGLGIDTNRMYIKAANAHAITALSSGYVGFVDETAPSTQLHVKDSGATVITVESSSTGNAGIEFMNTVANTRYQLGAEVSTGNYRLYDFSVARAPFTIENNSLANSIWVDNTGAVGIFDSTPSYELDVTGTVQITEALRFDTGVEDKIILYPSTYGIGIADYEFSQWAASSGDFVWRKDSRTGTEVMRLDNTTGGLSLVAGLAEDTTVLGDNGAGDTLTIQGGDVDNAGHADSIQIRLGYNGGDNYSQNIRTRHDGSNDSWNAIDFYVWDYGTDAAGTAGTAHGLTIANNAIGIGTITPSEELHIQNSASTIKARIETTATNGVSGVEIKNDAVQWDLRINGAIGDNFQFHDGTSPIFSIEPGAPSGTIYADSTGAVALGGATVASTQGVLTLKPIATAPATCAIGDIYVDTSGAACFCTATNTWSNAVATGTCA